MSVRSTAAAWMLCAAVSCTMGATATAQSVDPLPIAGRRIVQSYSAAVDPSFTLAASWPLSDIPAALPCRVLAQGHLHSLLDELWSRSTTFRQQCRRLAGARAMVLIQGGSPGDTMWTAESRIGRLGDGRVMARVRIRTGRESVEVIAHELEHVLERVDGVNFALDAMRRGSGTSLAGGAYETRRATDAGRQVAKEVRRNAKAAQKPRPKPKG